MIIFVGKKLILEESLTWQTNKDLVAKVAEATELTRKISSGSS